LSSDSKISASVVFRTLNRPYRVTLPMVALVSLVPLYVFIAQENRGQPAHVPAIALDDLIPLQPVWSLVYGALYLFLIVLPVFVICQEELIRRTVRAYLAVWLTAYAVFLLYPTVAPRPDYELVPGGGFGAWGLQILYDADPPFNCFPSLHVAHSFVGALAVYRMHRGLGLFAVVCAAIVGLSTLFAKQHYVLDVVAGAAPAHVAYAIFLRGYSRERVPDLERRVAPVVATVVLGAIAVLVVVIWAIYKTTGPGL
jgi:membrane-associated phospholipid phosphatase